MKIVMPGGSGQVGTILARHLSSRGHQVIVLSRTPAAAAHPWQTMHWDGQTLDPAWTSVIDGADAVIHLSGRTVNCRYTPENRRQIYDSRVETTRLVGEAIAR